MGDEIRGRGRLVHTPDGDWFDPLAVPLNWARRPPTPSGHAIPVEGADFDAIEHRYELNGAVQGYATIYGRWLGGRIRVHRQADEPRDNKVLRWSDPPCEPPPGGWPRSATGELPDDLFINVDELQESYGAVTVGIFRPSAEQAVLVVAAEDVAVVEAHLRPQLADRLCVVKSRFTRRQLDMARKHVWATSEPWGVYGTGGSCDAQAQITMTVKLVRVTDEIADWADAQPAGLVALNPCLTPVP